MKRRRRLAVLCAGIAACASSLYPCLVAAQFTTVATSLSSFSGIEEPQVIYDPTNKVFSSNPYTNIVDEGDPGGGEMFRFTLRYYPNPQTAWPGYPSTFWDGNLDTTTGSSATDRQRAEVKGLGSFQQINTTYEYTFSFETDPNFVGTSSFCHIFQLKGLNATGGDPGDDPCVTLSLGSNDKGSLELYSPDGQGQHITIARTFSYAPNTWEHADIKITTSATSGSVMASINGDAMTGVSGVPVDITGLYTYRPKWGFYRGINTNIFDGINYIQDQNITASLLSANFTWDNLGAVSPTNGQTWDTSNNNWNNGTSPGTYANGSAVTFNDTNNGHYAVTLSTTVTPASVAVDNSSGNYIISGAGQIAGTGSLTKSGTSTLTLDTANTYGGGTAVSAGTLIAGVNGALPKGAVNITGGMLQLAPSTGLATITSLAISGSGTFDVNNNHVIINYGTGPDPIASIAALLATGYHGGAWNGAGGITSTAAAANAGSYGLGYADSADPGNPAGLSSGTLEIKYTLLGDANLDGIVNGVDFGILAANFNKGVTAWDQGDFDYNNIVNGIDFGHLAGNFNQGASGASDVAALDAFAAANGLLADVPEPAAGTLAFLAAAGALARRRKPASVA